MNNIVDNLTDVYRDTVIKVTSAVRTPPLNTYPMKVNNIINLVDTKKGPTIMPLV